MRSFCRLLQIKSVIAELPKEGSCDVDRESSGSPKVPGSLTSRPQFFISASCAKEMAPAPGGRTGAGLVSSPSHVPGRPGTIQYIGKSGIVPSGGLLRSEQYRTEEDYAFRLGRAGGYVECFGGQSDGRRQSSRCSLWQRRRRRGDARASLGSHLCADTGVPGTKMIYAGLKDEQKIGGLFAYLKQYGPDGKKM